VVETISQLFLNTINTYSKDDLMLYKKEDRYLPISTEEFGRRVKFMALGLKVLGVKPGDKLVILSENRPEWVMTDLANLCLGGITVPIYTSLTPEQIKYIIDDSDAEIVVCSNQELWRKVDEIKNDLNKVKHYISLEEETPQGVWNLRQVVDKGKEHNQESPEFFEEAAHQIKSDDLASIIYTSGTTGMPKGVMLTHQNFISNVKACAAVIPFSQKDTVLSFLPLSHVCLFPTFWRGWLLLPIFIKAARLLLPKV